MLKIDETFEKFFYFDIFYFYKKIEKRTNIPVGGMKMGFFLNSTYLKFFKPITRAMYKNKFFILR